MAKNKNFATSKTFWIQSDVYYKQKHNIRWKYKQENQSIKIKNKSKSKLVSVKTNDCIKDESVFVEMFNNHYINIVEKTAGIIPESLGGSFLFAKKWWRNCE